MSDDTSVSPNPENGNDVVVEEHIKNRMWYKTPKGYYRLTEKGWNNISTKVRLGTSYQDYQDKIAER